MNFGEMFNVGIGVTLVDHFSNVLYTLTNGLQRTRLTAGGFQRSVQGAGISVNTASIRVAEHAAKLDLMRASLAKNAAAQAIATSRIKELTAQYKFAFAADKNYRLGLLQKIDLEKANISILEKRAVQEQLNIASMERMNVATETQGKQLGLLAAAAASLFAAREGYKLLKSTIEPGSEFLQQVLTMQLSGFSSGEMAENQRKAFELAAKMPAVSATQALKDIIEARVFLGSSESARQNIELLEQMRLVMMASSDVKTQEQSQDAARSATKAAEMFGYLGDPKKFHQFIEGTTRAIVATRGMLAPGDYQLVAKYGAQAVYQANKKFLFEELPVMMLEWKPSGAGGGGGSRGSVGPRWSQAYSAVVQGINTTNKLPLLQALGLLPEGVDVTKQKYHGGWKGADIFTRDPVEWVQKILIPQLEKNAGRKLSGDELIDAVNKIFSSKVAAQFIDMIIKMIETGQFGRFQGVMKNIPGIGKMYGTAADSPKIAFESLAAALDTLRTAIGKAVVPVLIPTIKATAKALTALAFFFEEHPLAAKLTALAIALGSILLVVVGVGFAIAALVAMFAVGGWVAVMTAALGVIAATLIAAGAAGYAVGYIIKYYVVQAFDSLSDRLKKLLLVLAVFLTPVGAGAFAAGLIKNKLGSGYAAPHNIYESPIGPQDPRKKTVSHYSPTLHVENLHVNLPSGMTEADKEKFMKMLMSLAEDQHTTSTGTGPDESPYLNGAD